MIIMILRLTVPTEKAPEAVAMINSMVGPISVEPGCKDFGLYSDVKDADSLMLVEGWECQETLEKHIQSDEFRKILELMEMACRAPEISFYTVLERAGLELIKEVRG